VCFWAPGGVVGAFCLCFCLGWSRRHPKVRFFFFFFFFLFFFFFFFFFLFFFAFLRTLSRFTPAPPHFLGSLFLLERTAPSPRVLFAVGTSLFVPCTLDLLLVSPTIFSFFFVTDTPTPSDMYPMFFFVLYLIPPPFSPDSGKVCSEPPAPEERFYPPRFFLSNFFFFLFGQ